MVRRRGGSCRPAHPARYLIWINALTPNFNHRVLAGLSKEGSVVMTGSSTAHLRESTQIFEMMEHLGIEPGGGVLPHLGVNYLTAFRRCESCVSKQACRNWLDDRTTLALFAPSFCPNAHTLFELAIGSNVARSRRPA
jgi:hypothetical protein